ncbi:hypothetical protein VTN77DRAFT_9177 [Rasamsonia byssochlamydoides]|uniref:uncharacterized protein n=1 Tax=Rasamsonia byssochlamydoides TaxID=89139 RepID=UPI0037429A8A
MSFLIGGSACVDATLVPRQLRSCCGWEHVVQIDTKQNSTASLLLESCFAALKFGLNLPSASSSRPFSAC